MNRLLTILILSLSFFSGSAQTSQVCRPMLDPNISVPNGGIFRTWDGRIDGIMMTMIIQEIRGMQWQMECMGICQMVLMGITVS